MMMASDRRRLVGRGELTPAEKGRPGPHGLRALRYVRDHCPRRFATIGDPISFFSELGNQKQE
jgi:hypothetical protein